MNPQISISRVLKQHWRVSLAAFIFLFGLAIALGFLFLDYIALPLTLVGILPPSVYYFYTEALDRPLVTRSDLEQSISIAPMYANIEGGPSDFIRPAIFYRIEVENKGKSTAERARVQVRLTGDTLNREFYARWSGPSSSDEYDILPGQKKNVMILKMFLTKDFYERLDGLKKMVEDEYETDLDNLVISPSGNPPGRIKKQDNLESFSFKPVGYTPREQRPERIDRSIQGGWEGQEIPITEANIQDELSIKTRVIADNYRTDWVDDFEPFSFISLIQIATEDQYWQQQWQNQGLSEIKNRIRIKMKDWLENHSEFVD
ncbi:MULTISPECIES: hypothetical protein [unclassified Haloferax]|uniref:hypothetical protein n=1 Tax=unclassified Haloferax TaxID=2625095 RepID=UPI0028746B0A|nr:MULTISPECIES: hypothetical protein [unclassified Haloferax]MDS0243718.1 hypothetical protein [Haloferax sp. S2CR25]MDS0446839.1 hypothetical protein [Haloferax sp. S2CR25-2]